MDKILRMIYTWLSKINLCLQTIFYFADTLRELRIIRNNFVIKILSFVILLHTHTAHTPNIHTLVER